MKTPLQYARRLQQKREVFNPDGATLDIVKLNRYVNGVPGETKPVPDDKYLCTSTSFGHLSISTSRHPEKEGGRAPRDRPCAAALLEATLTKDFMGGQHGQALKDTATSMMRWMFMDGGVHVTPKFRQQLQALAEAYAVWSDESTESASSSSDEDAAGTTSSEASWVMSVPELDSEDQPERPWAASEAALVQWVEQLEPVTEGEGQDLFDLVTYERIARQEDRARPGLPTSNGLLPSRSGMRSRSSVVGPG
jgi:hypothetical protein